MKVEHYIIMMRLSVFIQFKVRYVRIHCALSSDTSDTPFNRVVIEKIGICACRYVYDAPKPMISFVAIRSIGSDRTQK